MGVAQRSYKYSPEPPAAEVWEQGSSNWQEMMEDLPRFSSPILLSRTSSHELE